jgi:nucleoid-associated protein EbfC
MTNIMQMLKQAQDVQAKMTAMQEKLAQIEVTGQASNGALSITQTVEGEPRSVKITAELVPPDMAELLEDLILIALRDYKKQAEAIKEAERAHSLGGLKLPAGFKLPF